MTKVAIIGMGNMGKGLAGRIAGKTDLVLGVRDPAADTDLGRVYQAAVATPDKAAAEADVVILAVPYKAALELAGNPALKGKVVVDITNPVKPDYSGLAVGHTTSAAEEIQKAAPGASVVKAFNTVFASIFAEPREKTVDVPVFIAGNDAAAVGKVEELVKLVGFRPENVGGLDGARLVEPLGMLNIRFGYGLGRGTGIAPTWLELAA